MNDYLQRLREEDKTGHPALPCPHCGHDSWRVEAPLKRRVHDRPRLFPAICGHCGVLEDAHHVDGEWMGMHQYSQDADSLVSFIKRHAARMRDATDR